MSESVINKTMLRFPQACSRTALGLKLKQINRYQQLRMQQLVDELNTYSNAYYFGSEPLISDAEFDALMEELSQLEQASGNRPARFADTSGRRRCCHCL